MYNTNTSTSGPPLLSVDNGPATMGNMCGNTPRTPEILNSLMAMTNPLEYSYAGAHANQQVYIHISFSYLLDFRVHSSPCSPLLFKVLALIVLRQKNYPNLKSKIIFFVKTGVK